MSDKPGFASVPFNKIGAMTLANTNRDGTGTLTTLHTAPAAGSRVDSVRVKAIVTTTAGIARLYVDDGTARLISELIVDAITMSTTVPAFTGTFVIPDPFILESGDILKCSTEVGEAMHVHAMGGDFT